MTDAKAIRNSVEGRDDSTTPVEAQWLRGPSATELHKRAAGRLSCGRCGRTALIVYSSTDGTVACHACYWKTV